MKKLINHTKERCDGKSAFQTKRVPLSDCSDRLNRKGNDNSNIQNSKPEKASKSFSRSCFVSKTRDSSTEDAIVSDAIDLTWKKLKELGFSDEDTSWAIEEAKLRRPSRKNSVDSLTSVLDRLTIFEEPIEAVKSDLVHEREQNSSIDDHPSLNGLVLSLVLKRLDTWTLIESARFVNTEWKSAVSIVMSNEPPLVDDEQWQCKPVSTDQLAKQFPWGCFLAEGGE